ncbi:hypothetical protein [Mycolicibacterium conceptionense]|nr:hypothetical protein [Mycolicibacterium conceptionense]
MEYIFEIDMTNADDIDAAIRDRETAVDRINEELDQLRTARRNLS